MLIDPLVDRCEQVVDERQPIVIPALVPAVISDALGTQTSNSSGRPDRARALIGFQHPNAAKVSRRGGHGGHTRYSC